MGGVLLTFRRTALLAALALVPVFVNILLIDVFFHIAFGAFAVAFLILTCLAAVIAPHAATLRRAVLPATDSQPLAPRMAMVAALLIAGWGVTWLGVRYFKRQPTPIDGTWLVIAKGAQSDSTRSLQQLFFERNQAHIVVFRSATGDATHDFEVDADGVVRIWETPKTKGPLILQGRVLPDGRLQLDGIGDRAAHIVLKPERPPRS